MSYLAYSEKNVASEMSLVVFGDLVCRNLLSRVYGLYVSLALLVLFKVKFNFNMKLEVFVILPCSGNLHDSVELIPQHTTCDNNITNYRFEVKYLYELFFCNYTRSRVGSDGVRHLSIFDECIHMSYMSSCQDLIVLFSESGIEVLSFYCFYTCLS